MKSGFIQRFESSLRRMPGAYQYFMHLLESSDRWDAHERVSWQTARLEKMMRQARLLPGYQGLPSESWAVFERVPVLEKTRLQRAADDYRPRSFFPSAAAATGGTTGVPLTLKRSLRSVVAEQAAIDHILRKVGIDFPSSRVAVLRGDFVKEPSDLTPPFWYRKSRTQLICSSFHLSRATANGYLSALREFAPDVLMCYPSSLRHLSMLLRELNETLSIKCIFASSEQLTAEDIEAARSLFDARVVDYYGQAERVALSYSIDGGGHAILPVYAVAEFVSFGDEGLPEVVGTPLWNGSEILLRYRTGDVAVGTGDTAESKREVSLGLRKFAGIQGRTSEYIDLPSGRRIIGLNHIPRGVPGVLSLQLRQREPSVVDCYVVPDVGFGEPSKHKIRKNFFDKFPNETRLEIAVVDAPMRTFAGKAPLLLPKGWDRT